MGTLLGNGVLRALDVGMTMVRRRQKKVPAMAFTVPSRATSDWSVIIETGICQIREKRGARRGDATKPLCYLPQHDHSIPEGG